MAAEASLSKRNILVARARASAVGCLLMHIALLYVLGLVSTLFHIVFLWDVPEFSLWRTLVHPLSFLFSSLFSFRCITLATAIAGLTWVNYHRLKFSKRALNSTEVIKERYKIFVHGVYYFVFGVLVGISYYRYLLPEILQKDGEPKAVSEDFETEKYLFIILSCGVSSSYYFSKCIQNEEFLVEFPPVVTSGYIRLRGIFTPAIKRALSLLRDARYWGVLLGVHATLGGMFNTVWSVLTWSTDSSGDDSSLFPVLEFCSLRFLFMVVMFQLLVIFTLKSVWSTLEVFVTERQQFDTWETPGGVGQSLPETLTSTDQYLKRLAFYDLKVLTEFELSRALSLFALSHPGGNPKKWEMVCSACLFEIQELIRNIKAYVQKLEAEKRRKESNEFDGINKKFAGPKVEFVNFSARQNSENPKHRSRLSMRHLKQSDAERENSDEASDTNTAWENPFASVLQIAGMVKSHVKAYILDVLSSLNLLKFLKSSPHPEILHILEHRDIILWSVCSLTDVILLSCTMQKNGVIQQHLCKILTALTDLYSSIDDLKQIRDPAVSEKGHRLKVPLEATSFDDVRSMVQSIEKPVRNELMRIHATFEPFYEIVCLPASNEQVFRKLGIRD